LTSDEIAIVWRALASDDFGDIVRLLLLTGQRREEIGGLLWREVDLDAGKITLSPHRVKNGRAHIVPLSAPALAVIEARRRNGRDYVFGRGEGGFSGWSRCKERLDRRIGHLPSFVLHDIRRSVATGMGDLGIQPHVVEAVLNHISGHKAGVAGIYNRNTYEFEKRAALERWANHVETVTKR
jgi:integrase